MKAKQKRDTGGGCSICGSEPATNISGTYWLCASCIAEKSSAPTFKCPHCQQPLEFEVGYGSDANVISVAIHVRVK